MNKWLKKSSKEIYKNKWIRLREDLVIDPGGREGIYGVVDQLDGVFVVVTNSKERILLVRNSRYTTGITSWELPAGGISRDMEDHKLQAVNEVKEETDLKLDKDKLVLLGVIYPANGFSSGRNYIFKSSVSGNGHIFNGQTEEGIDKVQFFTLQEIKQMILTGDICDGSSISAIHLYLNSL